MSKAQLVITAVVLEGRSKSEVARDYDVSRQWVQQLCKRYATVGDAAYLPRSRRPHHSPQATSIEVEDRIIMLRKTLTRRGLDAGADTIAAHLAADPSIPNVPAISTIWRILKRRGFVTPQPHKRPRSSWKRFEAELPNQRWQADATHWHLARRRRGNPQHHRRPLPAGHRQPGPTHHHRPRRHHNLHHRLLHLGPSGLGAHRQRCHLHRTTPPRWSHRPGNHPGHIGYQIPQLPALPSADLRQNRALPPNPKEMAHSASRRHLGPAPNIARRVHRLLQHGAPTPAIGRTTPIQAFNARPKATPTGYVIPAHCRVRTDTIDAAGVITIRYNSRLHISA